MAYTPTNWQNNSTPAINATNLNKMETGIDEAHDCANIVYTPYGDIAATNVQAAISELEDEKESTSTNHASRHVTGGGDTIANAGAGSNAGLMTDADKTRLDAIEDAADVTDTVNVAGAGALMTTTYDAQSIVVAVTNDTPVVLGISASELVGRTAAGNVDSLTMAEVRAAGMLNIEDGATADQTGAEIKTLYEAEANAFTDTKNTKLTGIETAATKYPDTGEQAFLDADHTKLDGIATAATKYPDTGEQAFLDADHTKLNGIATGAIANVSEDATPQLGGDLDLVNYEILVDTTPGTDHTASGMKGTFTNGNAGSVAFGDTCFVALDGQLELADADATTTMPGLYMALGTITAASSGEFLIKGIARDDSWNWTVGPGAAGLIYVSLTGTTANTLTQTAPSTAGDQVQVVGHALSADTMMFDPVPILVEIA